MTESLPRVNRLKNLALILTLINTVFAAVLSGLQVDAGIRAGAANRDSQYYAILVSNELVRQGHQNAYELETFSTSIKHSQESLVLGLTALELEQEGESAGTENLSAQNQVVQARAVTAEKFSIFFNDPRYQPADPAGVPDLEAYLAGQFEIANGLLAQQNAAADDYQKWNNKSDAYVTVLTVLAIAFFLLGLAQSSERMRLFFTLSALAVMFLAGASTVIIFIR